VLIILTLTVLEYWKNRQEDWHLNTSIKIFRILKWVNQICG